MPPCRSYSPRMKMKAWPASAAIAAIAIPSISWCGLRCISSGGLKAPGPAASAVPRVGLVLSPRREGALWPQKNPGRPAAAEAGLFEPLEDLPRLHLAVGLLQRRVAAVALV